MADKENGMEPEEVEFEMTTLPAISQSEIDIQIATAKKYPRSIAAFKRQVREMATIDQETANSMFYVVPRAGKKIPGETIRFAEVIASAWGNVRYAGKIIDEGRNSDYVTAEGITYDVEKNVASSIQYKRRIVTKEGKRYNEDMVQNAMNSCISFALRNSIFRVIPKALVKDIFEECKLIAMGKGLTFEQQRTKAIEAFSKFNLSEADVLKILERRGLEDIVVDDIIALRGIYTALKDGDTTVDELLQKEPKSKPKTSAEVIAEARKRSESDDLNEEVTTTPPEEETSSSVDVADDSGDNSGISEPGPDPDEDALEKEASEEVVDTETGEVQQTEQDLVDSIRATIWKRIPAIEKTHKLTVSRLKKQYGDDLSGIKSVDAANAVLDELSAIK